MESKNLLTLAITLTVGIILAGSLLMPVISEATETTETYTNDGLFRLTKYDADADLEATWDYTKPNQITVNGEDVALPLSAAYLMTVGGNDGYFLRYGALTAGQYGIQLYDSTTINLRVQAATSSSTSMTISISDGTATFTVGTTTVTETISGSFFFVDANGSYIMKRATDSAYVKGDSEFYGIGRTTINTSGAQTVDNFYIAGSIKDGLTVLSMTGAEATYSDDAITSTAVDKHIDTYKLTGFTFKITYDSTETTASYSQIIVPYQVTSELSQHLAPGEIAILNALPVLIIVALVVMAAGVLYLKHDD